jgi:16S rRNA (guanine527-N7)-methyltransferase
MTGGMDETLETAGTRLNSLLAAAGMQPLDAGLSARFETYLSLLLRWNARVNLTAVRDEDGILSRHFVESIACARALPPGIGTLLDFGSGAGFPGIPIALCRPEIAVTLSESQGKKAAFLQEAVRVLEIGAKVYPGRAEALAERFDCVALRAVDRMRQAVIVASCLLAPSGKLALMTTGAELGGLEEAAGAEFSWSAPLPLPGGDDRLLGLGVWTGLPSHSANHSALNSSL